MKRFYILLALALLGAAIAVVVVLDTNRAARRAVPATSPVAAPFDSSVQGVGIAETGRGNVAIGTAVAGVVADIPVRVGDAVEVGAPLFRIDDRDLQARLVVARAHVREAEAALAQPRRRVDYLSRLQRLDNAAISAQAVGDARDQVRVAAAALGSAQAEAAQVAMAIERCVVRATVPARILQINIRVGEYVEGGGQAKPLMLLGDDARVYLRVDIDENEAWRIVPTARARARVRGNPQQSVQLRFEYLEPYIAPKTSLTGQSTERSDVRVLQVIYSFERAALDVYLGQQMDVFIEAPAPQPSAGAPRPR